MAVQGIGGLLFRATSPESLSAWYKQHLNVGAGCVSDGAGEPGEWVWQAHDGPVLFAPFTADSDYFAADKAFMINFRVTELDGMIEKLRGGGITVITKPEWDQRGVGKFAQIHDPEGNAIELWEADRCGDADCSDGRLRRVPVQPLIPHILLPNAQ